MRAEYVFYRGMAKGMAQWLRTPPPVDPEHSIRRQIERREANFLDLVRRVIFGSLANPYREMFELARCSFDDLEARVNRHGLQQTLELLLDSGVYLTHEEMKGKQPIVRSGVEIKSGERSFDNHLAGRGMETRSSGSRSKGSSGTVSTECRVYREAHRLLARRDLGFDQRAEVAVKPILPSVLGISQGIGAARAGGRVEKWFAPGGREASHYRAMTSLLVLLGNVLGAKTPCPTYLPENDFSPVARWIARRKAGGVGTAVEAFVSPATRIAASAIEHGLDISGTIFFVGGEALSDAKRATIEMAGAEVYPGYWIHEVGPIGFACRRMRSGNCVHLFSDSVAVVARRQRARLSEAEVSSLMFTTLLPFSPRVLINAEMGDSGELEQGHCDCVYQHLGFTERIRDISSYGKLTGHGVTLVGTDVLRLLEEILPQRFGGRAGDYQLVEEEVHSQTRIVLRASPRTGIDQPGALREYFLGQVKREYGGSLADRLWRHANAFEVHVAEPLMTGTGKVLPLHLLNHGRSDRDVA